MFPLFLCPIRFHNNPLFFVLREHAQEYLLHLAVGGSRLRGLCHQQVAPLFLAMRYTDMGFLLSEHMHG